MINKYIVLLTFIPWILIYSVSIIRYLNTIDNKVYSLKYIFKNFFKIFRIDLLFLIIVFFFFASYNKDFVDKYLFVVMNLYLFVNSFYEKKEKLPKEFFKDNLFCLLIIFIISLGPFIIYFMKKDIVLTYKIMLLYLFLEYIVIIIISYIIKKFKKTNS